MFFTSEGRITEKIVARQHKQSLDFPEFFFFFYFSLSGFRSVWHKKYTSLVYEFYLYITTELYINRPEGIAVLCTLISCTIQAIGLLKFVLVFVRICLEKKTYTIKNC